MDPKLTSMCRMGMGLAISPAIWQQFVEAIFATHKYRSQIHILMDDVLMLSTMKDHPDIHTRNKPDPHQVWLKLSPHKCAYFRSQLEYLGMNFMVRDGRPSVTPMRNKCDAIINLAPPTCAKDVRAFCGMVNFLSTFLPGLRELLIPLYALTGKRAVKGGSKKRVDVTFTWTEDCQKAFEAIKKLLVNPPVLRLPSPKGLFRLESDTSHYATGACLYQEQPDKKGNKEWVVVGYHSKRLPTVVKSYSITELELFGLLINIHGFKQLLRNRHFEVVIDHKAIEYIHRSKDEPASMRLKKLLFHLREYTFDLKYVKGDKMFVSDALSRLITADPSPLDSVIPVSFLFHGLRCDMTLRPRKPINYCETGRGRRNTRASNPPPSTHQGPTKRAPLADQNPAQGEAPVSEATNQAPTTGNQARPIPSSGPAPLHARDKFVNQLDPTADSFIPQPDTQPIVQSDKKRFTTSSVPLAALWQAEEKAHVQAPDTQPVTRKVDDAFTKPITSPFDLDSTPSLKLQDRLPTQREIDNLLSLFRRKVLSTWKVPASLQDLVQAYSSDPRFGPVYNYLSKGHLPGQVISLP